MGVHGLGLGVGDDLDVGFGVRVGPGVGDGIRVVCGDGDGIGVDDATGDDMLVGAGGVWAMTRSSARTQPPPSGICALSTLTQFP